MHSAEINALIPDVINITVSKCPCANDVAVLALICNDTVYGKLCFCVFEYRQIYSQVQSNVHWIELNSLYYSYTLLSSEIR